MSRLGKIARRTFMIGSAAIAGGVAFGTYEYLKAPTNPLQPDGENVTLNPYLLIAKDGITVITPRAEMGQGIHTTLAALVAEELDVPPEMLRTDHGPASEAYFNGEIAAIGLPFAAYEPSSVREVAHGAMNVAGKLLGIQLTGGSTSTIDAFERMRAAGAAARYVLLYSAAHRLGTTLKSLRTENGYVLASDGRKLSYFELASDAAKTTPPGNPELKPKSDWRYLGKSLPRVDMRAKVDGRAEFGIDIRRSDMLYATVRINPKLGGRMQSFDATEALKRPGVEKVVDLGNGIGVIATNTWRAFKGAEATKIIWADAPYPKDSSKILAEIGKAFDSSANSTLRDDGEVDNALKSSGNVISAEYKVPYLAHATMEPMNATALFKDGGLEIWAGNQAPTLVQEQAASVANLSTRDVLVHTPYMGGGFGRRSEFDFTNQAVKLAMAVPGRPVKLTWTREEDTRHDFYRPAAIARMQGVLKDQRPYALKADVAAQSVYQNQGERIFGFAAPGPDKLLVEGAFDQPYAIENYQVNGYISDLTIPVGSWRSVGNSYNGFFHECFLDELAHAGKLDPLQMRLDLMMGVHEASRKVLEAVSEMANWSKPKSENTGRGVAFTYSFGSPTAQIVEVSNSESGIRIDRVYCAIDVGTALDPGNIEAQVMSAIVYGLSAAVFSEVSFEDGEVSQSNFHDYEALRFSQAPTIETRVLENNTKMGGVGEPGTPPSMPALANAIFDLTGKRIRTLPLAKHVTFA